ncbi:MAG: hypothetical protein ACD_2C00017G0003 [uncultured bacterium (gcode 4)]|uniref:Uncharacterized protein n=1 Tax=uncultured bacterium (gcode 4) TaxID=1234023 RepID=K2FGH7_9BACT|nr:MAG: hypothetical protein ACD_2C00017G0003 [uncultured bacterium (gcode 4)]
MKSYANAPEMNNQPEQDCAQTAQAVDKVKKNIIFYCEGVIFETGNVTLSIPKESYKEVIEMKRTRIKWIGFEMDIWQWLRHYPSEKLFLMN